MTKTFRDASALAVIVLLGFLLGELAILRRPDLTRTADFLFGDQSYSLFVTSEVLGGARLYRDVAYPYGWLPVALYAAVAALFGNTPLVYLQFFLVVSIAGLLLAYVLLRRLLPTGLALFVTIAGLLPVFIVPGSLLGGYLGSFYQPMERLLLVLTALVWQPPQRRTRAVAAALGAIVALLQMIRFGPGLVLVVVILGLDLVVLATDPKRRIGGWLCMALTPIAVAAAGELLLAAVTLALLPAAIAWDVLWPGYIVQAYPPAGERWPDLGNWRLVVAQYFNPLAGMLLTGVGAWVLLTRRAESRDDDAWRVLILPLLFVAGAFTFFRTDHHFRQFAWTFSIGSAVSLSRYRWSRIVAIAGWIPVAAVMALSVVRSADPRKVELVTPSGWHLTVGPAEKTRVEGIHAALLAIAARVGRGPVLFDPNGAGFYVAYGIPHLSRETWFYRAAVRPYEIETLAREYRQLTAVVVCRDEKAGAEPGSALLDPDFPAALRAGIESRVVETVWRDGACRVLRLQATSDK